MTAQATLYRYVDREVDAGLERRLRGLRSFLCGKRIHEELHRAAATAEKSLVINFETIIEFDMELARRLINSPGYFLSNANRILEEITGVPGAHLCVRRLDKSVRVRDLRAEHVGKFVQTDGYVVDRGEDCFYIQNIDWAANIVSLDAPLRVIPDRGASHPLKCVCSNQGCGNVSFGKRVVVTGTLRAERKPVNLADLFKPYDSHEVVIDHSGQVEISRWRWVLEGELFPGDSTVFNKFLEVNHVGAPEFVPRETLYEATHSSSEKQEGRWILDSMRRLGLKCMGEGGRIDG